jgi:acetyl-CoA carboxylase alpha subunit
MADTLKTELIQHLAQLKALPIPQLLDARQARLSGFGVYSES